MPETAFHRTSHRVDITASAGVVYGIVADAVRWPLFLAPTVHVEQLDLEGADQRLRIWALAYGEVTSWVTRRTLDPAARRIDFRQAMPAPHMQGVSGSWVVEELPKGSSRLTLHHALPVSAGRGAGATWLELARDTDLRALLTNVKHLAELWTTLDERVVAVEDTLRVDGPAELVYDFLYRMENWSGQLPWLRRLDLMEETPGIQKIRMDTATDDGRTHTAEAVRVCFPHSGRIVYKLTEPLASTAAQTGEWSVEPDATGVTVVARHQAVLHRQDMTEALGTHADATGAHRHARQVLSRDSTAILRLARQHAQSAVRRITPKS
ncbi:SRPBCC family protein [Streptomyces sp. NPDC088746]|uniref:aromatase/cyclase n=1 Tax=Streptomyces sp. NPDC088746 TaxID=3365885 RepID=UPI00380BEDC0